MKKSKEEEAIEELGIIRAKEILKEYEEVKVKTAMENLPAQLTPVSNWKQPQAKPGPKVNWVKRITDAYALGIHHLQKSAEAFIACGEALIQAKIDLGDNKFTDMIRNDLPFKEKKAWALIHIAERPWIHDYADKLPVYWTVLGMVAKLEEIEFLEKINDGTINPEMTARDFIKRDDEDGVEDDAGDVEDGEDRPERTGRGKQGKGASSKANPQVPGVSRETALVERIFEAAIEL